jgi:hypothetical protein
MWLNIRWHDAAGNLLREDGRYGGLDVTLNGAPLSVRTLLDATNSKVYEAHYGMTQAWANQLLSLGYAPSMPLAFDRVSGAVDYTLGQLAAQAQGTAHETFHFVLNNTVIKDNRIPTWGMDYEEARKRNALPVPATQYGSPGAGGTYNHWDEIALDVPAGAAYADITLFYQSTSWEYVQFLYLANNRTNAFLADEGVNLLDAWLATGMAEPVAIAKATWGTPPPPPCVAPGAPQTLTAAAGKKSVTLNWKAGAPAPDGGYRIYYDQSGKLAYRAGVGPSALTYKDTGLVSRTLYSYVVTAWTDCNGNGAFDAGVDVESPVSNKASATAQ